jgi:hypothetical protein
MWRSGPRTRWTKPASGPQTHHERRGVARRPWESGSCTHPGMNAAHELRFFPRRKNRAASGRADLCQAHLHKDIRRATFAALSGCGARLLSRRTIAHSGRGTGFPDSRVEPGDEAATEGRDLRKRVGLAAQDQSEKRKRIAADDFIERTPRRGASVWALLGLVGPSSRPKHGQTLWPRDARRQRCRGVPTKTGCRPLARSAVVIV